MTIETLVATHTFATVRKIYAALESRRPIALLHSKATPVEHARQRSLLARATYAPDDALVLFSSGTTGPARGIVLSHAALRASADASAALLGWRDDDRYLCCLPLAHAGGLSVIIRCKLARTPFVLDVDPHAISACTLASLVPAQLAALLDEPAWRPPAQLRAVLLGGAAASPALIARAVERGVPVLPTYGLTETFGQVATARVPGGLPSPLDGVTITAGTAEPAPIRIRGPMLAARYLDGTPIAPELVTADLGLLEGDALHVIGRADDVIITGGENVHPNEIEAVLARTPGIRAAAAFGVPDPRWGQVVAIAIATDGRFDPSRATAEWHAALPPHARPRRLVVLDTLPQLPSGKIDRRSVAALSTTPIDY